MTDQLIADLKTARDIVQHHWCPRGLHDDDGNVCIVGALNLATCGVVNWMDAPAGYDRLIAAGHVLEAHLPSHAADLVSFNDSVDTTHDDVMTLFEKALADLGGLA